MLRKGSEMQKKDKEVLLDLDYEGSIKSYGSLQNGSFSAPKSFLDASGDMVDRDSIQIQSKDDINLQMGNYFRDGRTKIDFVLVWETSSQESRQEKERTTNEEGEASTNVELNRPEPKKTRPVQWRERFVRNLESAGLLTEKEETTNESRTIHFLKLNVPWEVMVFYAEELSFRAPLQAQPYLDFNYSAHLLRRLCIPNIMLEPVPNRPLDYYTCAFRKSKMENFLGSHDRENFFTNTQRHRVAYEILTRTVYGKRKNAQVGVDRLLNEGVYTAAFPLHEGYYKLPTYGVHPEELNRRQILYQYWARWRNWHKYQPLDHIREYFGEKIAFYFAWLGFYTTWLLPAALVGTLVFVSGLISMNTDTAAKEICNSGGTYLMCPLCNTCKAWNVSDICTMAKIGYLFDHAGTVFFSIFMSFWAISFLEYWKRKMVTLAHHWDCMEFHEEEERPRPEFAAMATMMEPNPVTGVKEPYFPKRTQLSRMLTGSMVIIIMLCVVMIFLVTVVMCRGIITVMMFHTRNHLLQIEAGTIANILSSIVNLCLILLMGRIYTALAEQLTKWEMPRTQTQYENAFIFKVFIFQFVNFYSSPFYVAFFKGRFVGYPNNYGTLFGMRNEDCGPGGCLIELAQQLFIIMVGKQFINNVQEFVIPKVRVWLQKRGVYKVIGAKETVEIHRWEEDYQLVKSEGLFEEYLEMVLQFGFITIFVAACPLAPLFALLNNWVEIRLDAHKFVCEYQRPVAERAQNIGVWLNILEILSHMSVTANAFLIAFTADFLPRLLYKYKFDNELHGYMNFTLAYAPLNYTDYPLCRYKDFRDNNGNYTLFYWELLAIRLGFIIAFEHVVFFVLRAIEWVIPDVPESLEVKIKRERYLAKQALAENHEVLFQGVTAATLGTSGPVNRPSLRTNVT
ncbi:anoctamin-7 isoform X1 [Takifugu rubripes]|uniref:Anoctamin n=1 Tax=Takifugu rubripes TaxID=31033 RepID=H2SG05_TAKRU|nr:anoctamin-7 isoform X1 [Takifugu rubripes]XP_011619647.1 anoctamin-7 isoform X1 [Takifugu rubripes]XP_011619650.1 anoctamin-7 isoform X1 [Takifugu rubripes]|eukprot:XP_011619642.1 PREDICTED: anoctamin-7 isoform X1 [Takifugu rubripes]